MLNYGKNFDGTKIPKFKKEENIEQVEYEKKYQKILYEYETLDFPKKRNRIFIPKSF